MESFCETFFSFSIKPVPICLFDGLIDLNRLLNCYVLDLPKFRSRFLLEV